MKNILVLVLILLIFSAFFAGRMVVSADQPDWDQSSLSFSGSCEGNCSEVRATVCNGEDSQAMLGESVYEVWYATSGNPKDGTMVATGTIPALEPGACTELTYDPGNVSGNYMFKAYQRPGHPGIGELWSEPCSITCEVNVSPTPTSDPSPSSTPTPTPDPTSSPTPTPNSDTTPTPTPTPPPTPTPTPDPGGENTSSSGSDNSSSGSSGESNAPQGQVLGASTLGATGVFEE